MSKKVRFGLLLGSACLILLCALGVSYGVRDYRQEVLESLVFQCESEAGAIPLTLWQDESDGRFYLFLPSFMQGQDKSLQLIYEDSGAGILLDGQKLSSGSSWVEDGAESLHDFCIEGRFGKEWLNTTVQVLTSEKMPSMFVSVEKPSAIFMDDTKDKIKYLRSGDMEILDEEGKLLCADKLNAFKVRGNLTATFGKKPYTFSLESPHELLGMESACKWNLLANATDGSYIRNKIVRDMAYECIDAYEPQGEFIELYLNGEYQGQYLLTEAVEIGENRIEIDPDQNWYVEMELDFRAREDASEMITDQGQIFIMHTDAKPKNNEIAEVKARLNDVESALYAPDGVSTISGKPLAELMDIDSFAAAWLVEELSGDHDIGITSQFAYAPKDASGKWVSGPAWDFDGIMGNVHTPFYAVPEYLVSTVAMARPEDNKNQNHWLSAMWNHPEFQEAVKEKYKMLFRASYEEIATKRIDTYFEQIRRSTVLDSLRWHCNRLEWWFTIPDGIKEQYQQNEASVREGKYDQTTYLKYDVLDLAAGQVRDFMQRKEVFLDKLWLEGKEFCPVEVHNDTEVLDPGYLKTMYYMVEPGTPIEHLPCFENDEYTFAGYFDNNTGEEVKNGTIINYYQILEGVWQKRE